MKAKHILIKVFNIFVLVFACIGAFCTGYIVVSCIKNAINKNDEPYEQYGEVLAYGDYNPKKGAMDYNGMNYIFSIYEIFTYDNYANYYYQNRQWWDSRRYAPSNDPDYLSIRSYSGYYGGYIYDNYSNVDFINGIDIPTGATYWQFDEIRIFFINKTTLQYDQQNNLETYQLEFNIRFYDNTANQYRDFYNGQGIVAYIVRSSDNSGSFMTYYSNYGQLNNWCVVCYRADDSFFVDLFTSGVGTQNTYYDGYQSGYSAGHTSGYRNGYTDGQNSVSITGNNPFELISQAFGAVANVFNIQILPNFPLGVLIVTPLVVTIIIVVVKMFKG